MYHSSSLRPVINRTEPPAPQIPDTNHLGRQALEEEAQPSAKFTDNEDPIKSNQHSHHMQCLSIASPHPQLLKRDVFLNNQILLLLRVLILDICQSLLSTLALGNGTLASYNPKHCVFIHVHADIDYSLYRV